MTVAQLIARLQSLDQTKRVMIEGYEYGLEDVENLVEGKVSLGYHDPMSANMAEDVGGTYGGPHERGVSEGFDVVDAVIFMSKSGR